MSQITARWQRTVYSFAELGFAIDHLLSQKYLEPQDEPSEPTGIFNLTEAGFEAMRRQARPRTSQRMRARNQTARKRPILLAEDDDAFREALEEELTRAGHHVVTAADGEEALQLLQTDIVPSLLLLDLMMPRVNGWQVLGTLRSDPRFANIPVVVLTAIADRAPRDVVLFPKPLQLDSLLSLIEEICRREAE
ncbi:MAG TPA: response regulator [Polyangia bacterium]|nr:response regulator [Polyangia bacterium]